MYSAITPEQSWLRHWDSTCVPPVFKVIGAYYIFWGVSNLPMFLMMFDTSGDRIGFRVELLLNLCILTISSVVDGILLIAVTRTGGLWAIYFDQITLMLPPVLSFLIPLGFIAKRYLKDQCNFTLPRRKRNDRPQKSGDIRLTSPQDLENLWRKDFKEEINRAARKHLLVDYVMYLEQSDNIERLSPGRYKHLYNTFVHPASLYELQISSDSRQRFGMYVGSPNADLKRNIVNEVRTSVFAYLYASIKNDLEMELRKENVSEKVVV
ncbi:hypothetical protein HK102_000710 [Quaeritorhiza haematococci]|nr:hypothetical protein HK102_000710 [Quaeritorhiza haematococci]